MASFNYFWPPSYSLGARTSPAVPPPSTSTCMSYSSPAPNPVNSSCLFIKVYNSANKKDWQDYTLRNLCREVIDTPSKLREAVTTQCGESVVPEEIGYFDQATKHWIHNRLDLSDVWDKIESGARVNLWCVCNDSAVAKKSNGKQASLDNENECD